PLKVSKSTKLKRRIAIMNQNMRNQIVRTGVKSVQALARKYPDMKVGFNIQIGKIDIAVLFGLTEEVEEELEEEEEVIEFIISQENQPTNSLW
ncbi:MAG: hypothetical protein ILP16_08340, partial [Spirochaetales bacterium]|nr:hypothetical protein [Spirochaetales bacterium]